MDGDKLRLPANRNCYRLSRVSWALLKLLVFIFLNTVRTTVFNNVMTSKLKNLDGSVRNLKSHAVSLQETWSKKINIMQKIHTYYVFHFNTTNIDIGFDNKQHLIRAFWKTKNAVCASEKVTNVQSSILFTDWEQVNSVRKQFNTKRIKRTKLIQYGLGAFC